MHLRLGVLTGGGDCPGLNAVLWGLVHRGVLEFGHEFIGFRNSYEGLIEPEMTRPLHLEDVRGVLTRGGTILGTSNKANPFAFAVKHESKWVERDVSDVVVQRYRDLKLDGLVCVGGDGTLSIAHRLAQKGLNVVGCPKTIDNDLSGTDQTFGFDTAMGFVAESIDRLHSTAEAHQRVMIVELMGRNAGFLALDGGLAGGADVILLPEIPYSVETVVGKIKARWRYKMPFSIIAVAEGARPQGGQQSVAVRLEDNLGRGVVRLGGAGKVLADLLAPHLDCEIRVTVLGHLQRGGRPSAYDRVLALMFGGLALDLVRDGKWDHMVCLRDGKFASCALSEVKKERHLDPDGDKVRMARAMGVCLGD